MKQFIVLEGIHFDEKGKKYEKGQKVKSNYDLDLIFPRKFAEDQQFVPEKAESKSEAEVSRPKQQKSFGKDRTMEFDSAVSAGLKVYMDDGAYTVVDPQAPTVALNSEPLKASYVDLFIQKYLKVNA